MGIDKANIQKIIQYSISKSLEGYIQEIEHARHHGLESTCPIYAQTHKVRLRELALISRLIPCLSRPKVCAQVFGRDLIQRKLGLFRL